ncbi:MAG: hypothetical protein L0Y64_10960, partial [Myxococcaceae bacterium]|nr:hypothetical protein [Myxococcaceae bacterium]
MTDKTNPTPMPPELRRALNPETVEAIDSMMPAIDRAPVEAARQFYLASNARADAIEADPKAAQLAALHAFLANPPNPSVLRRKVEENKRLQGFWRQDIEDNHRQTPRLTCNFCNAELSADLKWALAPLVLAVPPLSTLACLECTEVAYLAPRAEDRLKALKRRGASAKTPVGERLSQAVAAHILKTQAGAGSLRSADVAPTAEGASPGPPAETTVQPDPRPPQGEWFSVMYARERKDDAGGDLLGQAGEALTALGFVAALNELDQVHARWQRGRLGETGSALIEVHALDDWHNVFRGFPPTQLSETVVVRAYVDGESVCGELMFSKLADSLEFLEARIADFEARTPSAPYLAFRNDWLRYIRWAIRMTPAAAGTPQGKWLQRYGSPGQSVYEHLRWLEQQDED